MRIVRKISFRIFRTKKVKDGELEISFLSAVDILAFPELKKRQAKIECSIMSRKADKEVSFHLKFKLLQ